MAKLTNKHPEVLESTFEKLINIKPIDISFQSDTLSIRDVQNYIKNDTIKIPEFQRNSLIKSSKINKSIWSTETQIFYVDSIFRNLPTSSILIWDKITDDSKHSYHIIDGSQRLSTISSFLDDKLQLSENLIHDASWYNKRFCDINDDDKTNFFQYRLPVCYVRYVGLKSDNELPMISEIYRRLNTGSYTLVRYEIRKAIFYNKSEIFKKIEDLLMPNKKIFDEILFPINKKRYSNRCFKEDAIIRIASYLKYSGSTSFTDKTLLDDIYDWYIDKNDVDTVLKDIDYIVDMSTRIKKINKTFFSNLTINQQGEYIPNSKSINYCFAVSIFNYLYEKREEINNDENKLKNIIDKIDSKKQIIWQKGYYENTDKKASENNKESYFFYNTVSTKSVDERISYIKKILD